MPEHTVESAKKQKPPAHEVILSQLKTTLEQPGRCSEFEATALVEVLGKMFIPLQVLPDVMQQLAKLGQSTRWSIGWRRVLHSLEKDRLEAIR